MPSQTSARVTVALAGSTVTRGDGDATGAGAGAAVVALTLGGVEIEATVVIGGSVVVGAGAGVGADGILMIGTEATAAGAAADPATVVVRNPHKGVLSRDRRGTQLVMPPIPARTNTQPLLSTYCAPV